VRSFATCANLVRDGAFVSTVFVGSVGDCWLEEIVLLIEIECCYKVIML
jgi:hypothetical protein